MKKFICYIKLIIIQVYNALSGCINNFRFGGDIIKRQSLLAVLLMSLILAFIFPSVNAQSTTDNSANVGLNQHNNVLKVNAASTTKAKIWYKYYYKQWYKHWYKSPYKKWYKQWYKSNGTWNYTLRYTWKYSWKYSLKYKWKWCWKYKAVATVSKCGVGAYNVVVTNKYVYATGRCSCSLYKNYKYHTRVFYNYNPATHHWGVLSFEQGPAQLTSPEGMWVAKDTDMDFCLVHGKSHDNRGVYLVPYNGVINGKKVKNGYFTSIAVPTTTTTTKTTNNTSGTISTVQR